MTSKISERIRYLRLKNNLTAKDLSVILGTSESAISLYENGKRKPSIELILKMADYFNVSTDFILGVDKNTITGSEKIIDIDFSEVLENLIVYMNNQNIIRFDGQQLDKNMKMIFMKNVTNILDNMRFFINI
ncbi:helix-turn-helix transcriptional regulator [Sedimentibacter sp.]|uniref:helix-turn-helix domain-containing protein n=1 Tax=Sedimentibacter sp. TaxID=1960295 RepID=UPI0028ACD731|nr:helix-turn-helix transcriptional regulator [Sedimentibacter sp.]